MSLPNKSAVFEMDQKVAMKKKRWDQGHFQKVVAKLKELLGFSQSGAWALKKSLMRPSFFLHFQEIRKKWSHWPGGQSAPRFYNYYNLCPCARPSHVGECCQWPGPKFKFSKTVEVGKSCSDLQLCQREIATDEIQEKKLSRAQQYKERECQCTDGPRLTSTQNGGGVAGRFSTHQEWIQSHQSHCDSS